MAKKYNTDASDVKGICYASKPNSFQIRANGSIGKCTVALNSKDNNVGKLNTDGTVNIDQKKFNLWCEGFENMDPWKLGCPWSYLKHKNKNDLKIEVKEVS